LIFTLQLIFSSALAQQGKINYLLDELKVARQDTTRIRVYNELAYSYRNTDIKKAQDYAKRGLEIAEKNNFQKGRADALSIFGIIFYRQGKYDSSIVYQEEALEIREKIKDQAGIAISYNSLALLHARRGNYSNALTFHLKALKIREQLSDKKGMAGSYNNIGTVYVNQKQYDLAIDNYEKSLKINQEIRDEAQQATCMANLGNTYMLKKDYKIATEYMFKSLDLANKVSDNYNKTTNFVNLGNTYKEQKKYPLAFKYLNDGIENAKSMGDNEAIAESLQIMAEIHYEQNELDKAIELAQHSLSIARQVGNKERILKNSEILYKVYKAKQDVVRALYYHEMFSSIKDSIAEQVNDNIYAELEARFRLEQNQILLKEQKQEMELMRQLQVIAEEDKKQQQYINIGGGVIVVLLLVFAMLVYRNYLQRQQHANRLAGLNHELRLQKEEILNQRNLIELQNHELKESNSQIGKSIQAALYIQQGVLPNKQKMDAMLGHEHFTIFHPRNVVSGDFYWVGQLENKVVVAVADCTGHGVPGAFMSIIGSTLLDRIVRLKKIADPATILSNLDEELKIILRKEGSQSDNGMDMGVVMFEKNDIDWQKVTFSGAKIPLRFIRKGNREIEQIQAVNRSVGFTSKRERSFVNHEIFLEKGSQIYMNSDGYADQDNSQQDRLGTGRFANLLGEYAHLSMHVQKTHLEDNLRIYQGKAPQRDDILVLGLKLT
jgi:serine phosphatase RsbU (regulator of sigma subunit)